MCAFENQMMRVLSDGNYFKFNITLEISEIISFTEHLSKHQVKLSLQKFLYKNYHILENLGPGHNFVGSDYRGVLMGSGQKSMAFGTV